MSNGFLICSTGTTDIKDFGGIFAFNFTSRLCHLSDRSRQIIYEKCSVFVKNHSLCLYLDIPRKIFISTLIEIFSEWRLLVLMVGVGSGVGLLRPILNN